MEFVLEIIGELISGLVGLILENERVPKAIRIGIICVLDGLLIALAVFMICSASSIVGKLVSALLGLLFVWGGFKFVSKILKHQ